MELWGKATCCVCDEEMKENDVVFVKMRYPKQGGFTSIKPYLKNNGTFICEKCFNDMTDTGGQ